MQGSLRKALIDSHVAAVIIAVLWFLKGREANLQQKSFLIAAACFAVIGVTVIAVIRMMRNR